MKLSGKKFNDSEIKKFFQPICGKDVEIRLYESFKDYSLYLYHSCFKLESDITDPKMSELQTKVVRKAKHVDNNSPIFITKTKMNKNLQDFNIYKKITKLRKSSRLNLQKYETNKEHVDANHIQNIHFTMMDLLQTHFKETPAEFSMIDVNFNKYMVGVLFTHQVEFFSKGVYVADFSYLDYEDGYLTLSDVPIVHVMISPILKFDLTNQFHSTDGPAIEISTDSKKSIKQFYIHGVKLDEKFYKKVIKRELSSQEVLAIENIEVRRVCMQYYGLENLIQQLKPKTLNKSERGNELIQITIKDRSDREQHCKVVKYTCPSTGRIYVSGVPENIQQADEAMAWKFSLTEEEYEELSKEA